MKVTDFMSVHEFNLCEVQMNRDVRFFSLCLTPLFKLKSVSCRIYTRFSNFEKHKKGTQVSNSRDMVNEKKQSCKVAQKSFQQ